LPKLTSSFVFIYLYTKIKKVKSKLINIDITSNLMLIIEKIYMKEYHFNTENDRTGIKNTKIMSQIWYVQHITLV